MRFSPGCSCCGQTCTGRGNSAGLQLSACGGPQPGGFVQGATVEWRQGSTVKYSRITAANGLASVFEPDPGTYQLYWSWPPYPVTLGGTQTITSACATVPSVGANVCASLFGSGPSATYNCCGGCQHCLVKTLHLTDAGVSGANFSYVDIGGGTFRWNAGYPYPANAPVWSIQYQMDCNGLLNMVYGTIAAPGVTDRQSRNVGSRCMDYYSTSPITGSWSANGDGGVACPIAGAFTITP